MTPAKDLRKEARFPGAMLPEGLRFVRVLVDGTETKAKVVDASLSGFGIQIAKPSNHFGRGSSLAINFDGDSGPLQDFIVYANQIDTGSSRVGVRLKEVGQIADYRKELVQLTAADAGIEL